MSRANLVILIPLREGPPTRRELAWTHALCLRSRSASRFNPIAARYHIQLVPYPEVT